MILERAKKYKEVDLEKFIYTKNEDVIKRLEAEGCKFIQKRNDGVFVYIILPSSTFKFSNEKDTWITPVLTF